MVHFARRISRRWAVLKRTAHWRDNSLAEVDVCLISINFLSEGVRFGAKSKLARMGVYLAYIPIRDNELGAEDDPLSQEIKGVV